MAIFNSYVTNYRKVYDIHHYPSIIPSLSHYNPYKTTVNHSCPSRSPRLLVKESPACRDWAPWTRAPIWRCSGPCLDPNTCQGECQKECQIECLECPNIHTYTVYVYIYIHIYSIYIYILYYIYTYYK